MVKTEKLKEIGLTDSEVKIYLSLLKLGEATVVEISKSSGLHRTNIYDSLEKLKEKGFISYLSKENKQFFRATNPESIQNYLREKEESIALLITELKALQFIDKDKVIVEVFKGEQGIKSVLRDILTEKKEVLGYSVTGQLRKYLPKFADYYFREQAKHKILHKFIYTSGSVRPPSSYYEIRYLPKEFTSLTIRLSYGENVVDLIYEPELTAIKIHSKQLAENFKKHFELLWKIAKK